MAWNRFGFVIMAVCHLAIIKTLVGQRTIHDNKCEDVDSNGKMQYYACTSEPLHLLRDSNAVFNVTLDPSNYTCGSPRNGYCTLGISECAYCDAASSVPAERHPVQYMTDYKADTTPNLGTWWQSVTWKNLYPEPLHINITISFDKSYELQNDMEITFESARPKQMMIEKSTDFGQNWTVMQYYEEKCKPYFDSGVPSKVPANKPDTVICTQEYSTQPPYKDGKVVFPVVKDRYSLYLGSALTNYENLYNAFNVTDLNAFLTFTDLRIQLMYPATNGLEATKDEKQLIKYYYAISDIQVIGGCSCNLHAKFCQFKDNRTVCQCHHNTMGDSCELCKPLFNNKPWQPGFYLPYPAGTANQCEACICNDHADSCKYSEVYRQGVCVNCYHNTTGLRCELCSDGFYKNSSLPLNDTQICIDCDCEMLGVLNNNTKCQNPSGQCFCKSLVTGRRCDQCVDQYYGLLLSEKPGECKQCLCNADGSVGRSNVCEKQTGQCPCKTNVGQRDCTMCRDGFYNFPTNQPLADCLDCQCDAGGSTSIACNKVTGVCTCRPNFITQHCNQTTTGYYAPDMDVNQYQPRATGSTCTLSSALITDLYPFTGRTFMNCQETQIASFEDVTGKQVQPLVKWKFAPAIRYSLNGTGMWEAAVLRFSVTGSSNIALLTYQGRTNETLSSTCPLAAGVSYTFNMANLTAGIGNSWISQENFTVDARCTYSISLTMTEAGNASQPIMIDSVVLLSVKEDTVAYASLDATRQAAYINCEERILDLSSRKQALAEYTCRRFSYATGAGMAMAALACDCDTTGSLAGLPCAPQGGQCRCKAGVYGRRCDQCEPGFFNLTSTGCIPCDCDALGSRNLVCNYNTGQCPCLPKVALSGVQNVGGLTGDLQCHSCETNHFGFYTGSGCQPCSCDPQGANITQCNDRGVCNCKPSITGDKCNRCQSGYYLFSALGCTPCNCTIAGSTSVDCDPTIGTCNCKANVEGSKCEKCKADNFNLASTNPDGCQRCFCYGHGSQCTAATGFTSELITADNTLSWLPSTPITVNDATHVKAPAEFLGNRLTSYGTTFSIYVQSRGGASVIFSGHKSVILTGQVNQESRTVYYKAENFTADSGISKPMDVKFFENMWYLNETQTVAYFPFYAILANLTSIHIQRKFGTESIDISNITMVSTKAAGPGTEMVTSVENCTCLESVRHVAGLSCQTCAQGFRRPQENSTVYDTCTACNCNNRGETTPAICDERTGLCLNCRNGTNGTNCESCSANVQGTNCDQCVNEFWGLGKDGCRACDCDSVGSKSSVCDKTSGNCTCQAHVVGRRCNECEDNYYKLTATGCIVCDGCYGLVMDEVNDLRQMRDNLTSLVSQLASQDNNTLLGPFQQRLDSTVTSIMSLLQYLVEAKRVEGLVEGEVERLNNTLTYLRFQLEVNAVQAAIQSNVSLENTTSQIAQGKTVMNQTIGTVLEANDIMTMHVYNYSSIMEELLKSIKNVDSYLTSVSSGALRDILNVGMAVKEIETNSAQARTTAQNTLQEAQANNQVHQSTRQRLTQLEIYINELSGLGQLTSLRAMYAVNNATKTLNDVIAAKNNASALQQISTNAGDLQLRAGNLRKLAEGLNDKANNGTATNQSVVQSVRDAQARTTSLTNQVNQLKEQSGTLQNRTLTAFSKTQNAAFLEEQVFTNASLTLDIMRDFGNRSAAIEKEANASLATVQTLRQSGEAAIANAESLQVSLTRAEDNSKIAKDLASQTQAIELINNAEMQAVNSRAEQLLVEANGVLNDIQAKSNDVISKNASLVTQAKSRLDQTTAQVAALQTKTNDATTRTTNATTRTLQTKSRIAQILADFQTVDNINPATIQELRTLLQQHRASFDQRQLQSAVQVLKNAMEEQRTWLDSMKRSRDDLQNQILRLKNVKDQLSNTP